MSCRHCCLLGEMVLGCIGLANDEEGRMMRSEVKAVRASRSISARLGARWPLGCILSTASTLLCRSVLPTSSSKQGGRNGRWSLGPGSYERKTFCGWYRESAVDLDILCLRQNVWHRAKAVERVTQEIGLPSWSALCRVGSQIIIRIA